jgi:hypothetical protein
MDSSISATQHQNSAVLCLVSLWRYQQRRAGQAGMNAREAKVFVCHHQESARSDGFRFLIQGSRQGASHPSSLEWQRVLYLRLPIRYGAIASLVNFEPGRPATDVLNYDLPRLCTCVLTRGHTLHFETHATAHNYLPLCRRIATHWHSVRPWF